MNITRVKPGAQVPTAQVIRGVTGGTVTEYHAFAYGTNQKAQAFTPTVSFKAKLIYISGYQGGTGSVLTADIYLADGNHKPTGAVLGTGSIDCRAVGGSPTGIYIVLQTPADLVADTEYCVVFYTGASPQSMSILEKDVGGGAWASSDSGATWTADTVSVAYFPYNVQGDFCVYIWGY